MLASHGGSSLALWSRGVYTSPGGLWAARLAPGGEWELGDAVAVWSQSTTGSQYSVWSNQYVGR
jgi:hypothetical protein